MLVWPVQGLQRRSQPSSCPMQMLGQELAQGHPSWEEQEQKQLPSEVPAWWRQVPMQPQEQGQGPMWREASQQAPKV